MSPEGTRVWRKTRRRALRGVRSGRHRAPQTKTETPMSASTAASLPEAQVAIATAIEADPEPDTIVECGFCHVSGLSSQMTDIGGGQYRCDILVPAPDGIGCVQRNIRWRETGAKGAPLLSSAELMAAASLEPLPEPEPALPPAQEQALAAFNEAHDEHDADARSEDEEPTPPSDAEEAQAEIRREAIEALRGPPAEPEPQDGGEAE